ncbi:MAG: 30S ribosomal protein S3 [Candidatus Spechtbacterales bacterium]|nr:30S ribosomal protein S3 [Candidatus Spechtbacterales bacterium]
MTHKTHPKSTRIGITKGWKSRWFDKKNYQKNLQQDHKMREYLLDKFQNAGINSIDIERFANSISILVHTSRPGLVIGRGGSGIEEAKKGLLKILRNKIQISPSKNNTDDEQKALPQVKIEVHEVRDSDARARLVALNVAEQLERRIPFRRVIKRSLDRVMSHKEVKGAKISVAGRLNGAEMARTEFVKEGSLPLQTLRADIDYSFVEAVTKYGTIGVKVWIYKGEKLE